MLELDFSILNSIQNIRSAPLDSLMSFMSFLGSFALPWILAALLLLLRKGERRWGAVIGVGMIFGLIVGSLILKHLVLRERPFNDPNGLLSVSDLIISPPSDRYSFPSAHSVTSFAAATGIFMRDKRFGAAAYVVAAMIAFSRVYLYVHFPSDVIAGAVVGILCAVAAKKTVDAVCAHTI